MFTGLIEDIGSILKMERRGEGVLITISCSSVLDDLKMGDSISADGVCLTITQVKTQNFSVEASAETARRTTLGNKKPKQKVNLERALRLNNRLGGHLVSGHIDEVAKISAITPEGSSQKITFQTPQKIAKYLVEKGSVAVDGISLTVNEVKSDRFSVNVIPYTASHTTLATKKVGDEVNIEVDILGKYVERLIIKEPDKKVDVQFLSEHGFL
ncbi:MAG: riboflavin synthase subunit alpha [Deltaproteobacteria bacterium DG_8]|nr:MAG: riboflavin synthase subunit alpha [Deltaproteobacteria bacterium DG_8]